MAGEIPARRLPLGYLTHVAGGAGAAQVYRETVELAVAAEELGFASFWLAQHHAGGLAGLLPSPLVLLAAIAERTSTIRLGTAVIAAALEDPLRLAEDAAVVDTLSAGRLQLGVGAGADPAASAAFGRDHEARHADCTAVVDAVCAALEGDALVPAAPGLRGRMWWATGSPSGTRAAAERGIGVLSGRPDPAAAADLAGYWTTAVGEPRVAACRIVAAGEDPAAVLERWRTDPVAAWAGELIVQTQPAESGFATNLATLRALAPAAETNVPAAVGPVGRIRLRRGTMGVRTATGG